MIKNSVSDRNWILSKFDENKVKKATQELGVSEVLCRLLAIRNVEADQSLDFLNPKIKNSMPNPFLLKSMDEAVKLIIKHIKEESQICIYGDYDVDGASSTSILARFLRNFTSNFFIFIPDRIQDGYGPNLKIFEDIASRGVKLIITVDCGTTSFEPIEYAKSKNIDVVVIDHHQSTETLPKANAIVNPNRFDETSNLTYLCAAGVAFLVLSGIVTRFREQDFFKKKNIQEPDLLSYLDLVALGTVCDVVPLQGLNRAFVFQGLKVLQKRNNLGIKTLSDVANINSKISTYHLGYVIGPKINAGGRIGKSDHGANLLLTEDPEIAFKISKELNQLNEKRKSIEGIILEEAIKIAKHKDNNPILVVSSNTWHEGIIGIIASRLKDHFNKPTFVINFEGDYGKGSARSLPGFDIGSAVVRAKQSEIITKGGGHKMAAGFSINKDKIDKFEKFLIELFNKSSCQSSKEKDLYIDSVLASSAVNEKFFNEIDKLAPFGSANREPRFVIENVSITKSLILKESHIKAFCKTSNNSTINLISFNSVNTAIGTYLLNSKNKKYDIAGRLSLNEWNGKREVQFLLDDLAISSD